MGDMTANFTKEEFRCRCGCGSDNISPVLVMLLQQVRDATGLTMKIASGVRCPFHNRAVGGKPNSAHLRGLAADIRCADDHTRYILLREMLHKFKRIEVAKSWLHVDVDESLPQDIVFLER